MKKKIAIVMGKMIVGGIQKVLVNYLKMLDYEKYEVTLFLPDEQCEFDKYIDKRVKIVRYNSIYKYDGGGIGAIIKHYLKKFRVYSAVRSLFYYLLASINKKNEVKNAYYCSKYLPPMSNEKFDVAISFHGVSYIYCNGLNRLKAKKKYTWLHGFDGDLPHAFIYKDFDKNVCVSQGMKEWFLDKAPFAKKKTVVIYNVQDTEEILEKAEMPLDIAFSHPAIVTVGRVSMEKGQTLIPECARILLDNGVEFKWYIIGDGDTRSQVEDLIKEFGVEKQVVMLGVKHNPYPYVKNADIYVQPSFYEGYCTTTIEAKILHVPVVTTNVSGMTEQFINGKDAIIVDGFTPQAIADGILKLLRDKKLYKSVKDNLKDYVFDNQSILKQFYDLMEE